MRIVEIVLLYLVAAPILGGLLAGVDRIITARMQGRVGPPVLQPFYDVLKLMEKENLVVRTSQNFYILFFFIFMIFTGALFFIGGDILLFIFALTLAGIFFVLGGYKSSSPYSFIGSSREILQMMAYEPMIIIAAIGLYMVTNSFSIKDIVAYPHLLVVYLPGVFFGFVYILTIKLRKSPFDLSTSHHAHQEIVKGITTEFTGSTLAMIEVAHWYESIFILGFVYLFFAHYPIIGIIVVLVTYFFEIFIDNTFARVKWEKLIQLSWLVALVAGVGNIIVLSFLR